MFVTGIIIAIVFVSLVVSFIISKTSRPKRTEIKSTTSYHKNTNFSNHSHQRKINKYNVVTTDNAEDENLNSDDRYKVKVYDASKEKDRNEGDDDIVVASHWSDDGYLQLYLKNKDGKYRFVTTDIRLHSGGSPKLYQDGFKYCPHCGSENIFNNYDRGYVLYCDRCKKYGRYLPPNSNGEYRKSCCEGIFIKGKDKKKKYNYGCNDCGKTFYEPSFTSDISEYKRISKIENENKTPIKNYSENHCRRCAKYIKSYYKRCSKCNGVICPRCGACFCGAPDYVLAKLTYRS